VFSDFHTSFLLALYHRYIATMDEDKAAATIAAAKRGKNARKQAAERKEQSKASSTIAAARKGKNARKERKEMSDGAVRIQSQYRGRQSRARCAETGADQAQRFYTPAEVAKHDRADDLMVSLFGKVLDLSELVRANRGLLVQPLIAAAGTDITHWFDDSTHDPCTYIDPETEIEVPFTPMGRFLHCVPVRMQCSSPPSRAMQPP
jgi:cytochrome b involved in lipid metabolism